MGNTTVVRITRCGDEQSDTLADNATAITIVSGTGVTVSCAHGISAFEFERMARRKQCKQLLRRLLMKDHDSEKSLVVSMRKQE